MSVWPASANLYSFELILTTGQHKNDGLLPPALMRFPFFAQTVHVRINIRCTKTPNFSRHHTRTSGFVLDHLIWNSHMETYCLLGETVVNYPPRPSNKTRVPSQWVSRRSANALPVLPPWASGKRGLGQPQLVGYAKSCQVYIMFNRFWLWLL